MRGIGIDICEVKRFDRLRENQAFLERVFTPNELSYCLPRKKASESLAARFAAKEAFSKALGTGISKGICLDEIEVMKDELGKPFIQLTGKTKEIVEKEQITTIHLTMSHEQTMAIAVVVLE